MDQRCARAVRRRWARRPLCTTNVARSCRRCCTACKEPLKSGACIIKALVYMVRSLFMARRPSDCKALRWFKARIPVVLLPYCIRSSFKLLVVLCASSYLPARLSCLPDSHDCALYFLRVRRMQERRSNILPSSSAHWAAGRLPAPSLPPLSRWLICLRDDRRDRPGQWPP